MAERDPSEPCCAKKRRVIQCPEITKTEKEAIMRSYRRLHFLPRNGLLSRQITYCNASVNNSFSRATCKLAKIQSIEGRKSKDSVRLTEIYPFCSIFGRGVEILNSFLEGDFDWEDDEKATLLKPLLAFFNDLESHEALRKLKRDAENEAHIMTTLAVHFFSKLSVAQGLIMDSNATRKQSICDCMSCQQKQFMNDFGDTSIGHKDVWHGNLDIVLGSCQVGVQCTSREEESTRGRTSVDMKIKDLELDGVRNQILSQTITFSFLQQKLHPLMKHFLIPCVLCSDKEVQFFFYDSKNDILLESRRFSFFISEDNNDLRYETAIAAWLVLNYKYLGSGPTNNIIRGPKAEFTKFAGSALDTYKTGLRFQNVDISADSHDNPWFLIDNGDFLEIPFEWPDEPFPKQFK